MSWIVDGRVYWTGGWGRLVAPYSTAPRDRPQLCSSHLRRLPLLVHSAAGLWASTVQCRVAVERAAAMRSNEEKPSYALDASVVRGWEIVVNGIPIEALLDVYVVQVHQPEKEGTWNGSPPRTGALVLPTPTGWLHPNALAGQLYDDIWKREYTGGGSVIAVYAEEPVTRHIYVSVIWQWRTHPPSSHHTRPRCSAWIHTTVCGCGPLHAISKECGEAYTLPNGPHRANRGNGRRSLTMEMLEQLGPPVTSNNADVYTAGEGEGVYFYCVKLPWSSLEVESPETF